MACDICAAVIGVMLFGALKFKISFKTAVYITSIVCVASEMCKIFTHIDPVENADGEVIGGVLSPGALPFHLCSILIFLIFNLLIAKSEKVIEWLKSFIVPVAILGGIMALLVPTSGVDFAQPYAYQCFVYHSILIWFGLYLITTKRVDLSLRSYARNMGFLVLLMFLMIWVNSALSIYETNFLYLVKPPMDSLPILNMNNGWYAYFFSLITVAFTLFTLFHVPFIIRSLKKKTK